jgi:hypothetical protein
VQGSTLAVWEVAMVASGYKNDAAKTAKHLNWPVDRARAALNYAEAFKAEIDEALAENEALGFAGLSRGLPGIEIFKSK